MQPDSVSAVPPWAMPSDWEDAEDTRFVQINKSTALTIWTEEFFSTSCDRYYARLFVDRTFVAAAKVMGPGNFDKQDANVLCLIEVHPNHRGHRYSVLLMDALQKEIGTIYRTGLMSKSGFANARHLDLPLIPGRELRPTDPEEYRLIEWEGGCFLHP